MVKKNTNKSWPKIFENLYIDAVGIMTIAKHKSLFKNRVIGKKDW